MPLRNRLKRIVDSTNDLKIKGLRSLNQISVITGRYVNLLKNFRTSLKKLLLVLEKVKIVYISSAINLYISLVL